MAGNEPPATAPDPFATGISAEVDLLVAILRLASVINRPMKDGVADPEGLTLNELRVLMCLGGEGELAGHELAELMGMPPMNASRALAALEGRSWIEPAEDPDNRRRRPYRISAAGLAALGTMTPEIAAVAEFLFADLDPGDRRHLAATAHRLVDRIAAWRRA